MGKNRDKKKKKGRRGRKNADGDYHPRDKSSSHPQTESKRELRKRKNKETGDKWKTEIQRFQEQVARFGLKLKEVRGDGNCLFRSFSDQLDGVESNHSEYRGKIMDFIVAHREYFQPFVENDEKFDDYVADMRKEAIWGGNMEIQAFSMLFSVNVVVHMLNQPAYVFTVPAPRRAVHLSYHQGQHYNSVRWENDLNDNPPRELPTYLQELPIPEVPAVAKGHEKDEEEKKSGGNKDSLRRGGNWSADKEEEKVPSSDCSKKKSADKGDLGFEAYLFPVTVGVGGDKLRYDATGCVGPRCSGQDLARGVQRSRSHD